jgi:hypothetical protein
MDDRKCDALICALGSGASRRTVLRGLLGVGLPPLADGACCADSDCDRTGPCTIVVCDDDHVCGVVLDPICVPDGPSCAFSDFCGCLSLCFTGPPVEITAFLQALCTPYLDRCPEECQQENPCGE